MALQSQIVPATEVRKGDIILFQRGDSTGRVYEQEYANVESAKVGIRVMRGVVEEEVAFFFVKHRGQKSKKLRTSEYRIDAGHSVKVWRAA